MENLRDVKEIKRLLNKAYGKNATPEDRRLAKLIMFSAYGLFGATLPYVPRETTEKGDDNMKQRKFKVGDIVKGNHPIFAKGKIGIIEEVDEIDSKLPYRVDFIGETDYWIEEKFLELVEEKKMENVKSLLKSGDIVVFGSGEKAKVFLDYESNYYGKGILAYIDKDSFMSLESYNEDLFTSTKLERYAINKIYHPKHDNSVMSKNLNDYDLIWERKEIKEMTMKEICKALGYEVKIKKEDK